MKLPQNPPLALVHEVQLSATTGSSNHSCVFVGTMSTLSRNAASSDAVNLAAAAIECADCLS